MSKGKSVFVTTLMSLMLAAITVGMYLLKYRAYLIIIALMGVYGFLCAAFNFCQWLGKETPLPPLPQIRARPQEKEEVKLWPPDEEWTSSYDKIKAELEREEPPQVESAHEIMGYEK